MASRRKLKEVLNTTQRRVLAFFTAVGIVAGAIGSVYALWPKPSDTMKASFASVLAYPEVSLEEYDARSNPKNVVEGSPTPRKTATVYQLAADDTTIHTVTSKPREGAGNTPEPTTSTVTEPPETSASSKASGGAGKSSSTSSTGTTSKEATRTQSTVTKGRRTNGSQHTHVKHRGGKITVKTPAIPFPIQRTAPVEASTSSPPRQAYRSVEGAIVTEGTGASPSKVNAVVEALSHIHTPEAEGSSPGQAGKGPTSTSKEASLPTTGAEPKPARLVLPKACTSLCGATQEIDKTLTYDPNPEKAAEAVAALFNDSRGELVNRRLYPIGAEVAYTVDLDGFAHKAAILEWSLLAKASGRALPRPWWRDVVVAHIEPTVEHESLSGTFWVPVPPERGDYLVRLVLRDAQGVPHATSDSTPDFH